MKNDKKLQALRDERLKWEQWYRDKPSPFIAQKVREVEKKIDKHLRKVKEENERREMQAQTSIF